MKKIPLVLMLLASGTFAGLAHGQAAAPTIDSLPSCGNFKSVMLLDASDVGTKLVDLAQAMPADKFAWHPSGDGFPSVSELYLIAATQYYHRPREWGLPRAAGYEYEGGFNGQNGRTLPELDKTITDKAQVIHELVDGLAYFKGITKTLTDDDMQKSMKISGEVSTPCQNLFLMTADLHEMLNRAVDYARLSGVTLPWMKQRDEQRRERGFRTPPTQ